MSTTTAPDPLLETPLLLPPEVDALVARAEQSVRTLGVRLVDFKLEFGRLADGTLVLADEISPDTCSFWDLKTNEKLDKDRFRRDMGGVEDAYREMMHRVFGE